MGTGHRVVGLMEEGRRGGRVSSDMFLGINGIGGGEAYRLRGAEVST